MSLLCRVPSCMGQSFQLAMAMTINWDAGWNSQTRGVLHQEYCCRKVHCWQWMTMPYIAASEFGRRLDTWTFQNKGVQKPLVSSSKIKKLPERISKWFSSEKKDLRNFHGLKPRFPLSNATIGCMFPWPTPEMQGVPWFVASPRSEPTWDVAKCVGWDPLA